MRSSNRRRLFPWVIALVLISLTLVGSAQPEGLAEDKITQTELLHRNWDWTYNNGRVHFGSTGYELGNCPGFNFIKEAEYANTTKPLRDPDEGPGVVLQNWRGFILKGNESQAIRVSIESIRPMDTTNIRKLISSNMTLDEIRAEIKRDEGDVIRKGVLRVSNDVYRLVDIVLIQSGNNTILDANVSELDLESLENNSSVNIGHLNVALGIEDGYEVSQGLLSMNIGKYIGKYRVLLDAQSLGRDIGTEGDRPKMSKLRHEG